MTSQRLRIRFSKTGDLRLTGHLDLSRAWERLFRRVGVSLAMSGGFHPRPRIHFPSALPMGEAGSDEVVDVEVNSLQGAWSTTTDLPAPIANETDEGASVDTSDSPLVSLLAALRRTAPTGLTPTRLERLPADAPSPMAQEVEYEFPLPRERQSEVSQRVEQLLAAATFMVERRDKPAIDRRDFLLGAAVEGDQLRFRLRVAREGSLRARDVLSALDLTELQETGSYATRTSVRLT